MTETHPWEEPITWLERIESRQRGLDATRMMLMSASLDQALAEPNGDTGLVVRALRAELALAFNLSEGQIETQLDTAHRLLHHYRQAWQALERAEISLTHARVIVDAGLVIGSGDSSDVQRRRSRYEEAVIEVAVIETPNRLRPIARRMAEEWAERPLDERQREAGARRRVMVIDREDGMADLLAHIPAIEAYAIHDRLTRIARAGERTEGSSDEPMRTRDQRRADAFADLLLAADERTLIAGSPAEAIRAHIQVTLPSGAAASLLDPNGNSGPDDASASVLVGYGPISTESTRGVVAAAPVWQRVAVDPASGGVLSVDRYRPSEQMRRLLGVRDRHCRFPGCRAALLRCDIDHTVDAALGGRTATDNLAYLCRGHHTLKHHTDWRVEQDAGGNLRWRSPTGRRYIDHPPGVYESRSTAGTRMSPVRFEPVTDSCTSTSFLPDEGG